MSRGGPRNRNGSYPDPESGRSTRTGLAYKLLPRDGYTGRVPAFPLPAPSTRERAVWRTLWRTPQAAMWNEERWRMHTVGLYCRWSVRAEDVEVSAAVLGQVHRLADQLGLTPAGLKENGWRMTQGETSDAAAAATPTVPSPGVTPRRMRPVVGIQAGRRTPEGD